MRTLQKTQGVQEVRSLPEDRGPAQGLRPSPPASL